MTMMQHQRFRYVGAIDRRRAALKYLARTRQIGGGGLMADPVTKLLAHEQYLALDDAGVQWHFPVAVAPVTSAHNTPPD